MLFNGYKLSCKMSKIWGVNTQDSKRQPTPGFLPGKSHGQRSMVGYSPWSHKGLDTTQWLNNNMVVIVNDIAFYTGKQ